MSLSAPEQGQVIRYAYLWRSEKEQGRSEGVKDRPCAVILSTTDDNGDEIVVALPITHTPPDDAALAMELPAKTKQRLGMDEQRSWVILSEANKFVWPGPDIRPEPGQGLETAVMGYLPGTFVQDMRRRYIELHEQAKTIYVDRL